MEYSYRVVVAGCQRPRQSRIEGIDVWDALHQIRVMDIPARIKSAEVQIAWPLWDDTARQFCIVQRKYVLAYANGREYWERTE